MDDNYWQFLKNTIWSEIQGVQIVSWRLLHRLKNNAWANDALEQMYLDEISLEWAKKTGELLTDGVDDIHKDRFGNILQNGDNVVLTKTLDMKGSSINAKLGTVVKNIKLVHDNPEQIEGRIENQVIVILTKFLRKTI